MSKIISENRKSLPIQRTAWLCAGPFFIVTSGELLTMEIPEEIQKDIDQIIDSCTGVGTLLDELTLLRVAIRAYLDGAEPGEAVAWASSQLSDIISKRNNHGK